MAIEAISLDWNGTVMADGKLMFAVVEAHCHHGLGTPPTLVEFIRNFHPPYRDYIRKHGSLIPESGNWSVWDEMRKEIPVHVQPGAPALLERFLRTDVPAYVVTANQRARVEDDLVKHGLRPLVKGLFADAEVKVPEIEEILRMHGIRPAQMMHVGDMPVDMRAAKATGVIGIGIAWADECHEEHHEILREAGARHTFSSLAKFHDALIRGEL